MLSKIDIKNIKNFELLEPYHQRIIRSKFYKKSKKSIKDLQFLLINKNKLKLKLNKVISYEELENLLDLLQHQ